MEEFEFLPDVTISWAKKKSEGDNDYGHWDLYSFKVNGDDRYFTYFKPEKSSFIPTKGMRLKMMKYEEKTKDGFTNYNVKEVFLDKQQTESAINEMVGNNKKPPQTRSDAPQPTISNKDISFYVSYAKDLMVAAMPLNQDYGQMNVEDLAEIVVRTGMKMMKIINGNPKPNTEPIKMPEPIDTFSDGVPLGEPPEWAR